MREDGVSDAPAQDDAETTNEGALSQKERTATVWGMSMRRQYWDQAVDEEALLAAFERS